MIIKLGLVQGKCNASALRHVELSWEQLAAVLSPADLMQLAAALGLSDETSPLSAQEPAGSVELHAR